MHASVGGTEAASQVHMCAAGELCVKNEGRVSPRAHGNGHGGQRPEAMTLAPCGRITNLKEDSIESGGRGAALDLWGPCLANPFPAFSFRFAPRLPPWFFLHLCMHLLPPSPLLLPHLHPPTSPSTLPLGHQAMEGADLRSWHPRRSTAPSSMACGVPAVKSVPTLPRSHVTGGLISEKHT